MKRLAEPHLRMRDGVEQRAIGEYGEDYSEAPIRPAKHQQRREADEGKGRQSMYCAVVLRLMPTVEGRDS